MNNSTDKYLFSLIHSYRSEIHRVIDENALNINLMHAKCLKFIAETPNCTANSIVQGLTRDKSQISILIKDMTKKAWIEKIENVDDKRSQLLVLTTAGCELIDKVREEEAVVSKRMQEGLSEQEIAAFKSTLQTMIKNLS